METKLNLDQARKPISIALYTADVWEHVCPTLRVIRPAQAAGMKVLQGSSWRNNELVVDPHLVTEADVIVIQRNFPYFTDAYRSVLEAVRHYQKPLVYDLDDLLIDLPKHHPDYDFYRRMRAAIVEALLDSDMVTCASPQLATHLSRFHANTYVLPNYLDDTLWFPPISTQEKHASTSNSLVVIGYCGGHSHRSDLELIAPILDQLLERYGNRLLLKFWGISPPALLAKRQNVIYDTNLFVNYADFVDYFCAQQVDIFVAPLQENDFNRCKSSLKFLEYSTFGVPGVYSSIEPYTAVVKHGNTGLLATTQEDWQKYLIDLIENEDLRLNIGKNALENVSKHWQLSAHTHEWVDCYARAMQMQGQINVTPLPKLIATQGRIWHEELESQIETFGQRLVEHEKLVVEQEQHNQALIARLAMIEGSLGWRLMQTLTPIRYTLAPVGSRREMVLQKMMGGAGVLQREGLRAFLHQSASAINFYRQYGYLPPSGLSEKQQVTVQTGTVCPSPAISVLYISEQEQPSKLENVRTWLQAQTWQDSELVVWNPNREKASIIGATIQSVVAPDFASLRTTMQGRYICVVSDSLLQQLPTYLEANLLALETEQLGFTINLSHHTEDIKQNLLAKHLPGDAMHPLLRLVVHKDCVTNELQLDVTSWLQKRHDGSPWLLISKILIHTTNRAEPITSFAASLQGGIFHLENNLLYGRQALPDSPVPPKLALSPRALAMVTTVLKCDPVKTDKPTVMMVFPMLAIGGAERVHLYLLEQLYKDVRFVVVAFEPHDPFLGTTADLFRRFTPLVYTLSDYLAPELNLSIMRYLIERFQPQTLYIANGTQWIYDALSHIKQLYPKLWIVNQVYDSQAGWINRYDAKLIKQIDAHIGTNTKICQAYVQRGALTKQVHLIEHCVDIREFDPEQYSETDRQRIRAGLGIAGRPQVITFMARLHPQKRPMDFVELARRFADESTVIFLFIGDGPLAEVVNREIMRMNLKNVIRRPFYQPSREIFAVSDVYVLPSEYEGMPLVILEAQAMGRPVVVTDVGNNREIIEATSGGVVVKRVGDIGGLYQGVRHMLQNPPDPVAIRQAVLQQLSQKYSILPEQMAARYQQVLLKR